MSVIAPYPVRVEGHLEEPSRGLWLVKWLLLLPHYVLLGLLWIALIPATVVAFLAVLFTGRYPRGLFDFNLGVLRWTWRVAFYAYGANGTDRYPPFTLDDVADYPARLEIPYPEQQRRGLPLLGWWLAGIPHYVVAGVFVGGGVLGALHWGGLIGLLVLCAAVVLLVTGSYPRQLYDFVLGLNRWAIRVVAYAAVMTPEYPPFRIDAGDEDPGGLALPYTGPAEGSTSGGKVVAGVFGGLAALIAVAVLVGGGVSIVLDQTQRDAGGYVMTGWDTYSTGTYALVSKSYRGGTAGDVFLARDMLGTVRVGIRSDVPVFVGIARTRDVGAYLGGVNREIGPGLDTRKTEYRVFAGGKPASPPRTLSIWDAKVIGKDATLSWKPRTGSWRIVLMNADASPGLSAELRVGARLPHLLWIGIGLLGCGALCAVLAAGLIYTAARPEARRER